MNRNLWLLAICQGLFLTNNVTFIAINGLVGLSLAPLGWMATLPIMGYVVGGALSTALVAKTQERFGRKRSFQLGLLVALASALLCAYAAAQHNFWLLCTATLVAGYYYANANLYRFAAAELAQPAWREKAVSIVMAGGLIGAAIGPNLAAQTRTLISVPFMGAYLALAVVALVSMAVLSQIDFPPTSAKNVTVGGRPLAKIMRQPAFIVAAASGALSYGIMNLLMAATPIARTISISVNACMFFALIFKIANPLMSPAATAGSANPPACSGSPSNPCPAPESPPSPSASPTSLAPGFAPGFAPCLAAIPAASSGASASS